VGAPYLRLPPLADPRDHELENERTALAVLDVLQVRA
jgi:hypothetical protein